MVHIDGIIVANACEVLLSVARAGEGIMRFSQHVVEADLAGTRVPLLTEYQADTETPIYVAYHDRRALNPRIRAFVDFLSENFGSGV